MARRPRYSGDLRRANRLYSARKAAGFKSVREVALRLGFSEAKLRSQEAATRGLGEDDARAYAKAFSVDFDWLFSGLGRGPKIDANRGARFKLRATQAEKDAAAPAAKRGERLRLARRIAGFNSVTSAARKFRWNRSTLSAHEVGQNDVSPDAARVYGQAFRVNPDWLLNALLPSGYPAEIEQQLGALLELHRLPESNARTMLPLYGPGLVEAPLSTNVLPSKARSVHPLPGDTIGEYDSVFLYKHLLSGRNIGQLRPERTWTTPKNYLRDVLGCGPNSATILAMSRNDTHRGLRKGDRLIIDCAIREPTHGSDFAFIRHSGFDVILVEGSQLLDLAQRAKGESFAHDVAGIGVLVGRVRGRIGPLT